MDASTPLRLPPEDKLDILQNLDEFHFWFALEDQRRCKRCGQTITGNQILVLELKGTRGRLRLQCPTVGCVSTPGDWIYADPVLAAKRKIGLGAGDQKIKSQPANARLGYRPAKASRGGTVPGHVRQHRQWTLRGALSFREAAARVPILRSIATRLHAFHPVA